MLENVWFKINHTEYLKTTQKRQWKLKPCKTIKHPQWSKLLTCLVVFLSFRVCIVWPCLCDCLIVCHMHGEASGLCDVKYCFSVPHWNCFLFVFDSFSAWMTPWNQSVPVLELGSHKQVSWPTGRHESKLIYMYEVCPNNAWAVWAEILIFFCYCSGSRSSPWTSHSGWPGDCVCPVWQRRWFQCFRVRRLEENLKLHVAWILSN